MNLNPEDVKDVCSHLLCRIVSYHSQGFNKHAYTCWCGAKPSRKKETIKHTEGCPGGKAQQLLDQINKAEVK